MGKELAPGRTYTLKLATQSVECEVQAFNQVVDSETLESDPDKQRLVKNEVGSLVLKTKRPVVFDPFQEVPTMGRFVIVDDTIVSGGGIIERGAQELAAREHVETKSEHVTAKAHLVTLEERDARHAHKAKVLWLTGLPGCGKDAVAPRLERALFDRGREVYYLDAANIRLSLSSDLDFSEQARHEHARRVAETANMLLHAGLTVVVNIVSPYKADRAAARALIGADRFLEVYVDRPLEECKEANPHGIYTRAEKGEIAGVPGVDIPYESSDYLVTTLPAKGELDEQVAQLVHLLENA
jgi:bifunctional enzyme CysN/CysC/sulfate adenylyltransferase subunit 1